MKKIILVTIVFACGTAAMAQLKWGGMAGIGPAGFANNDNRQTGMVYTKDIVAAFHLGVFAELHPIKSNVLSMQVELSYDQNGGKQKVVGYPDDSATITNNYVYEAVLFKYQPKRWTLLAGAKLGERSGGHIKTETTNASSGNSFNSMDFGLVFGTEYHFPFGLFFTARSNPGLVNILKSAPGSPVVKNAGLIIGVGFRFAGKAGKKV